MTLDVAVQIPAALLAAWRLTDLIVVDTIAAPLRARVTAATCVRCVSVWAGIACTGTLLWAPWLNWPLAMSWLYLFLAGRAEMGRLRQQVAEARQQAIALFQENQALKSMNGGG